MGNMEMGKTVVYKDKTLIIRKYDNQRDEEKIIELWQTVFNNEMPLSLWRWKYLEAPYETAILICENSRGMPVVLYGGVPYKSTCCGKEVSMIHLADIMSHPDYRGSGLFIHTANAYFDCFGGMNKTIVMYGFPGKYHFYIGKKYLQYSPLGRGVVFLKAKVKTIKLKQGLISGRIDLCPAPDNCFDRIWQQTLKSYPLSVIRDSAYMAWRYFHHPEKTYEVWRFRTRFNKEWQAFMVIRIKDKKAVVVDILAPDSEKLFHDFLGNIAAMLIDRGIQGIETWIPEGHFLAAFFLCCGFKKKREPIGIIPTIRLFDETLDMNWAGTNFYYTMGDCDLF